MAAEHIPAKGMAVEMGSGEGRAGLDMEESSKNVGQFNAPGNTVPSISILYFLMYRVGHDCLFPEIFSLN